jgi:hypothetical protein
MAKQLIHWGKDNKTNAMHIQLIQGEFSTPDALELVTQMVQLKIKYHENKIATDTSEEDIKYRESKIKRLQKELTELREAMILNNKNVKLEGTIKID